MTTKPPSARAVSAGNRLPARSADELDRYLAFAGELADRARPIARRWFRSGIGYESKADSSPVTQADRAIEQTLRERIGQQFPDHAILGEEFGSVGAGALRWVIDPIDGTKSFLCGMPLFGTLVALLDQESPIVGVIDMPILNERWQAIAGQGATFNGQPARVSACCEIGQARLFSTSPDLFKGDDAVAISRVDRAVALRRYGGDCYQYGLLASGHCDLVIEAGLQRYDVMALIPIIEGAGGVVCNWRGLPAWQDFDGRVIAAATPELAERTVALLSSAPAPAIQPHVR